MRRKQTAGSTGCTTKDMTFCGGWLQVENPLQKCIDLDGEHVEKLFVFCTSVGGFKISRESIECARTA